MAKINFNEEFAKQYDNSSLLSKFDVEEKAHVELNSTYGDAILQAKKTREQMKDDFKDQDKLVDEFLKTQDLEENPELPKLENKDVLKSMKLAEDFRTMKHKAATYILNDDNGGLGDPGEEVSINDLRYMFKDLKSYGDPVVSNYDSFTDWIDDTVESGYISPKAEFVKEDLDPNRIHDYIDEFVPMEDLGKMAYKWLSSDELVEMLVANGYYDFDDDFEESLNEAKLNESSIQDMISAFENKIDELEGTNESLEESVDLKEDYANFIGRPLKDFLKTLPRSTSVNIDYEQTDDGVSGINGRVNQVPWSVADRLIKDIQLGDERYYKFKILTEDDKKKEITEARKAGSVSDDEDVHRYKVIAADEDSNNLYMKDVKGLGKVSKVLADLSDEKLSSLGATQVYVTRDDDKEVYLKFINDDGSWDVIQDELDMEKPVEERDTLFNHIVADLNAESTPDQKALRRMSRKGEGYVGFEDDEIGFADGVFHLKSQSDKPINWAKKVAEFYGLRASEVKIGQNNYKYIDIFAPGIEDDPKLVP